MLAVPLLFCIMSCLQGCNSSSVVGGRHAYADELRSVQVSRNTVALALGLSPDVTTPTEKWGEKFSRLVSWMKSEHNLHIPLFLEASTGHATVTGWTKRAAIMGGEYESSQLPGPFFDQLNLVCRSEGLSALLTRHGILVWRSSELVK